MTRAYQYCKQVCGEVGFISSVQEVDLADLWGLDMVDHLAI